MMTPTEIAAKLARLTEVSEREQRSDDWHERRQAEAEYLRIDAELHAANVPYHCSKKAKMYLYQRYSLVVDGNDGEYVFWTLRDRNTGLPAKHMPGLAREMEPVMFREPMKTHQIRANAEERCEAWDLVEAGRCGACGKVFAGENDQHYSASDCSICYGCAASRE